MSSTRHATAGSSLRQERYASSAEFERGLIASMVARRCSALDDPKDRELVWFLQYISHRPGGLRTVAEALCTKYRDWFGTKEMIAVGKRSGQTYNAEEVRRVRAGLPVELRCNFPLRGETSQEVAEMSNRFARQARYARELREAEDGKAANGKGGSESAGYPGSYPVDAFIKRCVLEWTDTDSGEVATGDLCELCLDPGTNRLSGTWYFNQLIPALRRLVADWIQERGAGVVITALGEKVCETLDYTLQAQAMTLIQGEARTGKSFAARAWCEQHPGQARFIEVPPGNDDKSFFRALAIGLGLGSFQQYKAIEIRERVENVLLSGDLLLCLDEAHRLWPEVNLWRGFPKRINWVMSMANKGVPICLIGTPQFIERQKVSDQCSGWNSAQFTGRLGHFEPLPRELSLDDLTAVARSVLPEADTRTLRALAAYARTSARYLAAIDAIAKRARYIAGRDGRSEAITEDVRRAMQESVIPADSKLVSALRAVAKPIGKPGRAGAVLLPQGGSVAADELPPDESPRANRAGREIVPPGLSARARSLEMQPA